MGSGSWDMPWDDPRAGEKGSGPRGGRGSYGRGSTPWGSGPWGSGPPPWLHGLLGLAQSGMSATKAPRARRGDVRAAILDVLAVEPMNGYQVIQQIAERSGGAWKPSPGSVYPTVQQLEDEGLVVGVEQEGRRLLTLTDAGHAYVAEHPEELAATWRAFDEPSAPDASESHDLKPVIGQVMSAVWQVVVSGTRQQQAEAAEILGDTRRRLYNLLADGDPR